MIRSSICTREQGTGCPDDAAPDVRGRRPCEGCHTIVGHGAGGGVSRAWRRPGSVSRHRMRRSPGLEAGPSSVRPRSRPSSTRPRAPRSAKCGLCARGRATILPRRSGHGRNVRTRTPCPKSRLHERGAARPRARAVGPTLARPLMNPHASHAIRESRTSGDGLRPRTRASWSGRSSAPPATGRTRRSRRVRSEVDAAAASPAIGQGGRDRQARDPHALPRRNQEGTVTSYRGAFSHGFTSTTPRRPAPIATISRPLLPRSRRKRARSVDTRFFGRPAARS